MPTRGGLHRGWGCRQNWRFSGPAYLVTTQSRPGREQGLQGQPFHKLESQAGQLQIHPSAPTGVPWPRPPCPFRHQGWVQGVSLQTQARQSTRAVGSPPSGAPLTPPRDPARGCTVLSSPPLGAHSRTLSGAQDESSLGQTGRTAGGLHSARWGPPGQVTPLLALRVLKPRSARSPDTPTAPAPSLAVLFSLRVRKVGRARLVLLLSARAHVLELAELLTSSPRTIGGPLLVWGGSRSLRTPASGRFLGHSCLFCCHAFQRSHWLPQTRKELEPRAGCAPSGGAPSGGS